MDIAPESQRPQKNMSEAWNRNYSTFKVRIF